MVAEMSATFSVLPVVNAAICMEASSVKDGLHFHIVISFVARSRKHERSLLLPFAIEEVSLQGDRVLFQYQTPSLLR